MGQRLVRNQVLRGINLYHMRQFSQAIEAWHGALSQLRNADDKFITHGYLSQIYYEMGNFRYVFMLDHALSQIDIAEEHEDLKMTAEAYLSISLSNQRLACFHRAIFYARLCMKSARNDPELTGTAHLYMAVSFTALGFFNRALEMFNRGQKIAKNSKNSLLEIRISLGFGTLFTELGDFNKAVRFVRNALILIGMLYFDDVRTKYRSFALCHMATALRKLNKFKEASQLIEVITSLMPQNFAASHAFRPPLIMLKCYGRLKRIYALKDDAEQVTLFSAEFDKLIEEMDLKCNFCSKPIGCHQTDLQALPCSDLFHSRYLADPSSFQELLLFNVIARDLIIYILSMQVGFIMLMLCQIQRNPILFEVFLLATTLCFLYPLCKAMIIDSLTMPTPRI
ncbi:unnamed protein product [Soboliphyme baturini]|uniref:TPR_REGION domain-containing protein n=1 Tax=Soboliphyme baturini TaxID=241478 RepID=A0A183IFW5_9BILA|nr:unnamed protein product [Soboliphyme baturini]